MFCLRRFIFSLLLSGFFLDPCWVQARPVCQELFAPQRTAHRLLKTSELENAATEKIFSVQEFQFIRKAAEERGLRVWLFGGTAASYLHYVKWDLMRRTGQLKLQADRFDYDYTNIFRSTQDLDIVVDATPEKAKEFEQLLKQKFPHFLGSKENKWEVRSLKHATGRPGELGYKEALLNDLDFSLQNSDSNSLAMVEITSRAALGQAVNDPVVRDLRSWNDPQGKSQFLTDALKNEITYLRNPRHFETARARLGENPEILSVIRVLVKAFQYELTLSPKSEAAIRAVIQDFNPKAITNEAALRRIKDTSEKLIKHAVNLEYAINKLDELGLKDKLISLGDAGKPDSFAWWLNKEPLRTKPIGQGSGPTAKELGIDIVAHETKSFLAYESITRAHSGQPNVLISRQGIEGEMAVYGNGFYTRIGRKGAVGSGLTIRFRLHPNARLGKDADFTRDGDFIIVHNKAVLEVIPESLNFEFNDLIKTALGQIQVDGADQALIEKLRRRLNVTRLRDEAEALLKSGHRADLDRLMAFFNGLHHPVMKRMIDQRVQKQLAELTFDQIKFWSVSPKQSEQLNYLRLVAPMRHLLLTHPGLGFGEYARLSNPEFTNWLESIISAKTPNDQRHGYHFYLRREAFFELLKIDPSQIQKLDVEFSSAEGALLRQDLATWKSTNDHRKLLAVGSFSKSRQEANLSPSEVLADPLLDLNMVLKDGNTPLTRAIYDNDKIMVLRLLRTPGTLIHMRNQKGWDPLQLALEVKADFEVIRELIRAGSVYTVYDMAYAMQHPDLRVFQMMFKPEEHGRVLVVNHQTLLHLAARLGRADVTDVLLQTRKIDINQKEWLDGNTALMLAINGAQHAVMARLLKEPGLDLSIKNNHGLTALELALQLGDPITIKMLNQLTHL